MSLTENLPTVSGSRKSAHYYAKSDGVLASGWLTVDGKKYYMNPSTCERESGWVTVDGEKYYLSSSTGALVTISGLMIIIMLEKDGSLIPDYQNGVSFRWPFKLRLFLYQQLFLETGNLREESVLPIIKELTFLLLQEHRFMRQHQEPLLPCFHRHRQAVPDIIPRSIMMERDLSQNICTSLNLTQI